MVEIDPLGRERCELRFPGKESVRWMLLSEDMANQDKLRRGCWRRGGVAALIGSRKRTR